MKKKIEEIKNAVKLNKDYSGYIILIIFGVAMALFVFIKIMGFVYIDSDWFWFIAGLGLAIEGMVSLIKQKKFNTKYKVLTREEFENFTMLKSKVNG